MKTRWKASFFALLGCSLAGTTPVQAAGEGWQFELTPYVFGPSFKGELGVHGVTADVDFPVSDALQHLDRGLMGMFEARKGAWGFGFDFIYARLKSEKANSWQGPGGIGSGTGDLEVSATSQIYQFSANHRLWDASTKLDVVGGLRYTRLENSVNLVTTTGGLLPGNSTSLSDTKSWWDPVIGARFVAPVADKWSFLGYADVGGFGVGSDITYQLIAGAERQFSKTFSAKVGYRYLYQDYENNGFVWKIGAHGPYLGLGIGF